MKRDIDQLMEERGLDVIIVPGSETYSPYVDYLGNGATITRGLVVKRREELPIIVANVMEVEEASASGLTVLEEYALGYSECQELAEGDSVKADALFWGKVLDHIGVDEGTVGIYGTGDIHAYLVFIDVLRETLPQYNFVGDAGITLFDVAFETKDTDELVRILSVAERTSAVVRATREFIASHRANADEVVIKDDDTPLTIGDVKRFIRVQLLENDLEEAHTIFAQGREAGFPHSRGTDSDPLRMGEAIVFDLFPREIGGGYYHDMTRTWSIGYATEEVQEAYTQVMNAFDIAVESFMVNKPTHHAQEAVQTYFEEHGHPTGRSHRGTAVGYMHSLGHGLGLNVHEAPYMRHTQKEDIFRIGNVVTIEPGLYYPDRGFGVRVEDTFYVDEQGQLIGLTDVTKDLIIPLRGQ